MATAEERIAEAFDAYFAQSGIRIGADEVVVGTRREVRRQGWRILMRVVPDEGGSPSLEFYATHRMTNDRHVRIWADGHLEHLDAIDEFYAYDAKVPGAEEAARQEYLRHNRRVAEELRASGLYPEGDINAYLRTGQDEDDPTSEEETMVRRGRASRVNARSSLSGGRSVSRCMARAEPPYRLQVARRETQLALG